MLEAEGLTIARGRRVLLREVALRLDRGDLLHVAGPNGCGKSSLLRVLAGVAEPRHGRLRRHAPAAYVPEHVELPAALPVSRWLRLTGGVPSAGLPRRAGHLSKGQLQQVLLAGALRSDAAPQLLVLDEPWAGVDAEARAVLSARLADRASVGCAVVFTDHSGALPGARRLELGP